MNSPIGAGATYVSSTPLFALGTVAIMGHDAYTYAQAGGTIAANDVLTLNGSYVTAAGTGYTAPAAASTGQYLWMRKTTSPF